MRQGDTRLALAPEGIQHGEDPDLACLIRLDRPATERLGGRENRVSGEQPSPASLDQMGPQGRQALVGLEAGFGNAGGGDPSLRRRQGLGSAAAIPQWERHQDAYDDQGAPRFGRVSPFSAGLEAREGDAAAPSAAPLVLRHDRIRDRDRHERECPGGPRRIRKGAIEAVVQRPHERQRLRRPADRPNQPCPGSPFPFPREGDRLAGHARFEGDLITLQGGDVSGPEAGVGQGSDGVRDGGLLIDKRSAFSASQGAVERHTHFPAKGGHTFEAITFRTGESRTSGGPVGPARQQPRKRLFDDGMASGSRLTVAEAHDGVGNLARHPSPRAGLVHGGLDGDGLSPGRSGAGLSLGQRERVLAGRPKRQQYHRNHGVVVTPLAVIPSSCSPATFPDMLPHPTMRIPTLRELFSGLVLVSAAAATAAPLSAQGGVASRPSRQAFVSRSELGALVGLLAIAFAMDQANRMEVQELRSPFTDGVARIGDTFGDGRYLLPAVGAAYLAGRVFHNDPVARTAWRAGKAAVVAGGATLVIKELVGRARPWQGGDADSFVPFDGRVSFPSGHTAVAFAVATAVARSTADRWSDIALYSAATLTALARINDDAHWTSDVLAGAALGYLTGRWATRARGGLPLQASSRGIGVSLTF